MNKYRAINVVTGDTVEGTAREVFRKTGIYPQYVYKYTKTRLLYKGRWKFERVEE